MMSWNFAMISECFIFGRCCVWDWVFEKEFCGYAARSSISRR